LLFELAVLRVIQIVVVLLLVRAPGLISILLHALMGVRTNGHLVTDVVRTHTSVVFRVSLLDAGLVALPCLTDLLLILMLVVHLLDRLVAGIFRIRLAERKLLVLTMSIIPAEIGARSHLLLLLLLILLLHVLGRIEGLTALLMQLVRRCR